MSVCGLRSDLENNYGPITGNLCLTSIIRNEMVVVFILPCWDRIRQAYVASDLGPRSGLFDNNGTKPHLIRKSMSSSVLSSFLVLFHLMLVVRR